MSQIHRPWPPACRQVRIAARLLQEMEELACMDDVPPPDVVAPLWARREALRAPWPGRRPADPELEADNRAALGGWLDLEEAHVLQRLRGWNRARRGAILVDARWLTAARNVMDNLTYSFEDRCEDEIEDLRAEGEYAGELLAKAEVRVALHGTCGECDFCRALDLRDECDRLLDAAGFDGGVYYHAYARGESQAQLAERYGRAS
jgi:hypothetical protein